MARRARDPIHNLSRFAPPHQYRACRQEPTRPCAGQLHCSSVVAGATVDM